MKVKKEKKKIDHSKKLTNDIRSLLWLVTIGGIALAFYEVAKANGFVGEPEEENWESPAI